MTSIFYPALHVFSFPGLSVYNKRLLLSTKVPIQGFPSNLPIFVNFEMPIGPWGLSIH